MFLFFHFVIFLACMKNAVTYNKVSCRWSSCLLILWFIWWGLFGNVCM